MVCKIRQEEQDAFDAFHRQKRGDAPVNWGEGIDMPDVMDIDNPPLHVGDIIQYHQIGFVCCSRPVVTASVLKINTCSVGGKTFTVDLCTSDMIPQDHQVQKIYEYANNKFVKIDNPIFIELCDYTVGRVDTLDPAETPTTFAKLLHNDVSSSIKKLNDKFQGSGLMTNLFTHNSHNSDDNKTKILRFEVEDQTCFHNSINFINFFDNQTFDDRVELVHGMSVFLAYVEPIKNNGIVEFIDTLSDNLIQKRIDFQEYISEHFENMNIYPTLKSNKIWYFMKCLCHNYIFLSNFYNHSGGINRPVRCPLKQLWDFHWSRYFNLAMIIDTTCLVRNDKIWTDYQKHVDRRAEKNEIGHQLMSIFISFCTQILQGD